MVLEIYLTKKCYGIMEGRMEGRTDGRTDRCKPVYTPHFLKRGYKNNGSNRFNDDDDMISYLLTKKVSTHNICLQFLRAEILSIFFFHQNFLYSNS